MARTMDQSNSVVYRVVVKRRKNDTEHIYGPYGTLSAAKREKTRQVYNAVRWAVPPDIWIEFSPVDWARVDT